MRTLSTALFVLLIASPAGAEPTLDRAFKALSSSTNGCNARELGYDYWPDGNLRNLVCHVRSVLPFQTLIGLAPRAPFVTGPHMRGPNLDADTFGHYDPSFVRWLGDQVPRGAARKATAPVYKAHVRRIARGLYDVRQRLLGAPGVLGDDVALYRENPSKFRQEHGASERFGHTGNNWDLAYLRNDAWQWWLRREIDGSASAFDEALGKLLEAYDGKWLRRYKAPPPAVPSDRPTSTDQAPEHRPPASVNPTATSIKQAWTGLKNTKTGACGDQLIYDYWPDGGMRNFYCRAASVMAWQTFRGLSPHEPFLSGPHGAGLDLENKTDFGRYNPDFVRWAQSALIPAAQSGAFRASTQSAYKKYVRSLARTYWQTYRAMKKKRGWLRKHTGELARDVDAGRVDWSKYPAYEVMDDKLDPNLQRSAVLFWLRRNLDETAPLFEDGLRKLLQTYDAKWLKQRR